MKVLFVCSGNICRSPMAAAYCRSRAARSAMTHLVVESAGTLGIDSRPASPEAIEAMREIGIDLTDHRSRGVRSSDLRTADLVLAMDHGHLEFLARRFPGGSDQRLLFRSFEDGSRPKPVAGDVEDPIGRPLPFYRGQRSLLTRCVDHLLLHLKHRP